MVRILVLHYSQTGQLTRALESMLGPLSGRDDIEIVRQKIEPATPYPFPWSFFGFLDAFPESVYLDPPPLAPMAFDPDGHYDLVILGYTVWFLSPALPVTGFLKSPAARVLRNKPVITFIACRNMWLSAQEEVKKLLADRGARHVDNVVLVDQGPPWATFVTTPRWMLSGKKAGFWRVFPPAGVSETDIRGAARFGRALTGAVHLLQSGASGPLLSGLGAVKVNPRYVASERLARRSFRLWGGLLRAVGRPGAPLRRAALLVYLVFLIGMILTVLPLGILVRALLRPLLKRRMDAEVARLELPSGSGTERVARFN